MVTARIILSISLFICTLPMLSVLLAGTIAKALDCKLEGGSVQPCMCGGVDIGGVLYSMSVAGWFSVITIPAGVMIAIAWTITEIVRAVSG